MSKHRICPVVLKDHNVVFSISSPKLISCSQSTKTTSQSGLTLVEVLLTITIAALIASLAVPSFSTLLQSNRISSQTNDFVSAMVLARSEAIKRKANIDVIAINSSNDANEWGKGWIVAVNGGDTLRVFSELTGGVRLNSIGDQSSFQFNANGRVNAIDNLTLCLPETGSNGRLIAISRTGRVSTGNYLCS